MPRASKRERSLFPHIRRGTARIDGMLVDSTFVMCSVCKTETRTIRFPLQVAGRVLGDRGWLNPCDPHRVTCLDCVKRAEAVKVELVKAQAPVIPATPQPQEAALPKGYPNPKPDRVVDLVDKDYPVAARAATPLVLNPPLAPPRAEEPRQATAADRRRIYDAIEARYDLAKPCYTGNWSDAKLAEAINVPRAWVVEVRSQFFGPDISAERMAAPAKLAEHEARLKTMADQYLTMAADCEKELNACRETRLALEGVVSAQGGGR